MSHRVVGAFAISLTFVCGARRAQDDKQETDSAKPAAPDAAKAAEEEEEEDEAPKPAAQAEVKAEARRDRRGQGGSSRSRGRSEGRRRPSDLRQAQAVVAQELYG